MESKIFVATKAFILNPEGKVLILRESSTYDDGTNAQKFDVPGGRLTPGEHFMEALKREVAEETGLAVEVNRPFFTNEWRPVVRGEQWQIVGTFFLCATEEEKVVLSRDHDMFEWIDPKKYQDYPLIENVKAVFSAYLESLM